MAAGAAAPALPDALPDALAAGPELSDPEHSGPDLVNRAADHSAALARRTCGTCGTGDTRQTGCRTVTV
ncbi:hypothetical protein ACWDRR_36165 [Kitasatospora sp. NPDC003701]